MPDLVVAHRLDDGPAALIIDRQSLEMTLQMPFDLALRFRHESKACRVSEDRGRRANAERSGIPERVQYARPGAQLFQSSLAPGEVIGLFPSGVEHEFPHFRPSREQRLSMVESLCGHLAGMVDPHESSGLAAVWRRKRASIDLGGGRWQRGAAGGGRTQKGPQGPVGR